MFWFVTKKVFQKQLTSIAFDITDTENKLLKRIEFLSEKIDFLEDKIKHISK